jgi:hypothetical protein
MDDGQKAPRGHPDFNSHMKILRVSIFQTDGQMDKQTDRQGNTPTACGLEEPFSGVLERFLKPIHALHVYCKN